MDAAACRPAARARVGVLVRISSRHPLDALSGSADHARSTRVVEAGAVDVHQDPLAMLRSRGRHPIIGVQPGNRGALGAIVLPHDLRESARVDLS